MAFKILPILKPPKYLYHGTSLKRWERIKVEGLKPYLDSHSGRLFAILFSTEPLDADIWAAVRAGRDSSQPIVLKVDTECAGVPFREAVVEEFTETELTFGAKWFITRFRIKPECISVHEMER